MATLPSRMTAIGIKAPGGPEVLVPGQAHQALAQARTGASRSTGPWTPVYEGSDTGAVFDWF